jgi:hypothetical protein
MITLKYKDTEIKKFISTLTRKNPKALEKSINDSALFAIRSIKEKDIPKRTGTLRKSYFIKTKTKFSKLITTKQNKLRYASAIEFGRKSRTIRPKRGKFLVFPLDGSVMTSTKSRMRKLSSTAFKEGVKRGKIGLARKVRQKRVKGQFNIRDKTRPKTMAFLRKKIISEYKKLGFK